MKRFLMCFGIFLSLGIIGCIESELTLPTSVSNYSIKGFNVLHGYKPNGNLFSAEGNFEYYNYFTNVSVDIEFLAKTKNTISNFAYAGPTKLENYLDEIHFECQDGDYTGTGVRSMDDIVNIDYNGREMKLVNFNALPKSERLMSLVPIKFYITQKPNIARRFVFAVELVVDGLTYNVTTNGITLH
jgi:hypothetical protein